MFTKKVAPSLALIAIVSACHRSQPPARDVSGDSPERATPSPTQAETATAAEVQNVIARTYKAAVTINARHPNSFVTGDFHGDISQDIAIIDNPAKGMLEELNSEYANWTLVDALQVALVAEHKQAGKAPVKPARVMIRGSDMLLAVIHGHQAAGWRDPKAMQTYLIKNAVADQMQTQSRSSLLDATTSKLPPLIGDVIHETRDGKSGFIYWTGAKYAWHAAEDSS
jgi:hypothetical protein